MMTDSENCERCKLPIIGTRYTFRVEADPPIFAASPVDVSICTACLESMQRWMERRQQRRVEASSADVESPKEPAIVRSRVEKSKKKNARPRSRYDANLNRAERWLQIRAGVTISVVVLAFTVLFVLIAMEISVYTQAHSGRGERSNLKAPPLPTVDPPDAEPLK